MSVKISLHLQALRSAITKRTTQDTINKYRKTL